MSRIFFFMLFLSLSILPLYAQFSDPSRVSSVDIQTYVSVNTGASEKTTNVSTATFLTSYRILGFQVVSESARAGNYGILYDCAAGGESTSTMFGEVLPPSLKWDGIWYPFPKRISTQLTIVQGAYTRVNIYYIKE